MKRFAISDIHGCAATFKALLQKINFTKKDELYLLGDYIDRGPDSKGVIDHIWKLQEEGYTVQCLLGNHEDMCLNALKNRESEPIWLQNGGLDALHSFGIFKAKSIPQEYVDWMKNLSHYLLIDDYILVHAGLNFRVENPFEDFYSMLWIRRWTKDINQQWLKGRIIVHGHTPTPEKEIKNRIKSLDKTPAIVIDNGCVFQFKGLGNLVAFDLDSHELYFQDCIDH